MESDLKRLLEGRSAENGEGYRLERDGRHIRGGVNLTLSDIRFNDDEGVCNRADVANMLDSWVVDLNESRRFYKAGLHSEFTRIHNGVLKSLKQCLYRMVPKQELKRRMSEFMAHRQKATAPIRKISDRDVAKVEVEFRLMGWVLDLMLCMKCAVTGDRSAFEKASQQVYEQMLRDFFEITSVSERKRYSEGEIL